MAPTVGDRAYLSAPSVPRVASHNRARLGDHLAITHRQYYLYAQRHARFLGSSGYGYDLRDVSGDAGSSIRSFLSTTWVGMHRGRRTVPRNTTHVRAWVVYAVRGSTDARVHLRVQVTDGSSNVDTGTRSDIVVENSAPRVDRLRNLNPRLWRGERPFSDNLQIFQDAVEVELSNVSQTNPGRCRLGVDGYATYDAAAGGRGMMPFAVSLWALMRY